MGIDMNFPKKLIRRTPLTQLPLTQPLTQQGVTLLELLTVVVIVAVVVSLALPSFTTLTRQSRVTNTANDLLAAVTFARGQAIDRQRPVSLRANGASWTLGWLVGVDPTRTPSSVTAANALKAGQGFNNVSIGTVPLSMTFQPDGSLVVTAGLVVPLRIQIDNVPTDTVVRRSVCVRNSGQAYVVKGATLC
jgi:prepilin-type N-terminal cleavage/methylation domain-containing protein